MNRRDSTFSGVNGQTDRLVFHLKHQEYLTQCKDPDKGKSYGEELL